MTPADSWTLPKVKVHQEAKRRAATEGRTRPRDTSSRCRLKSRNQRRPHPSNSSTASSSSGNTHCSYMPMYNICTRNSRLRAAAVFGKCNTSHSFIDGCWIAINLADELAVRVRESFRPCRRKKVRYRSVSVQLQPLHPPSSNCVLGVG